MGREISYDPEGSFSEHNIDNRRSQQEYRRHMYIHVYTQTNKQAAVEWDHTMSD